MPTPLRLANSGSRSASPRFRVMLPPALTAKEAFGSRQALGLDGSMTTQYLESQASPTPSPSSSAWSRLAMVGQLSWAFSTPSLSMSLSQASPMPSPSVSSWSVLEMVGQLSRASSMPSPSVSTTQPGPPLAELVGSGSRGHLSCASAMPSLSSSGSQASPRASPSVLTWSGL